MNRIPASSKSLGQARKHIPFQQLVGYLAGLPEVELEIENRVGEEARTKKGLVT